MSLSAVSILKSQDPYSSTVTLVFAYADQGTCVYVRYYCKVFGKHRWRKMATRLGGGESRIRKELWLRTQLNLPGASTLLLRASLTEIGGGPFTPASSETGRTFNKEASLSRG